MIYLFLILLGSCTFLADHPEVVKDGEEVIEDVAKYELYKHNPDIEKAIRFEKEI